MSDFLKDYLPTPFVGGFDNRRLSPTFAPLQKVADTIFTPTRNKDIGFPFRPPEPKAPFWPFLIAKSGGLYDIWFWDGYVVERRVKPQTGGSPPVGLNPIHFHAPSNIYAGSGVNLFPITEGQAAYVEFDVGMDGEVTGVPEIVIADEDVGEGLVRYYPPIGDYAGQSGRFSYKLCSLIDGGGGDEKLKIYLAGDNVHHIIERFAMTNLQNETGVFYNVLKTYIPDDDEVQFRSLEQLGGSGVGVISPTASGANTIAFRRVKQRESPSTQVQVSEDSEGILVQGNGVDGTLMWYDCEGNSLALLTWEDGLITSGSISFTAGCSTATPTESPTELPP